MQVPTFRGSILNTKIHKRFYYGCVGELFQFSTNCLQKLKHLKFTCL